MPLLNDHFPNIYLDETLAKVLLEVDDVDAATAALEEAAAALELRIQGLGKR